MRNKTSTQNTKKLLSNIEFTNDANLLKKVDVFIITVPTPIDEKNNPNLNFIKSWPHIQIDHILLLICFRLLLG